MTNITASIVILISTNWTEIGTFTPKGSSEWYSQKVEEGRIVTNTCALFEWKGSLKTQVLESVNGPIVDERKVPSSAMRVIPEWTNWIIKTPLYVTNVIK